MRLFQHQTVSTPYSDSNSTPLPPPPPPFLTDEEEERSKCLLRESTTHLREGRQRLPTPDKVAIMELSSSFDKRRLGKQQQILSEITQRCREQEVTDLSSKISAKVLLKSAEDSQTSTPFLKKSSRRRYRTPEDPMSSPDLREYDSIERRLNFEKGYKFFPARRIIRQPSRTPVMQTPTKEGYPSREMGSSTRMNTDMDMPIDPDSRTQDCPTAKGSNTIQKYLQPKLDAVPPLLLADLHAPTADGEHPQDRIGYYFSPSRLPLSQRSRTYFDTSRNSSRNVHTVSTGSRSTGARRQNKVVKTERGLHSMIQEILTDMDTSRVETRKRGPNHETPLKLKSCAPTARPEVQKV